MRTRFVFCESKLDGLDGGYVNGELINRNFDKGRGIKAVCDYLNVTPAGQHRLWRQRQ